jgi:hypothetical protein
MDHLADIHRKMNVPTYSYALVGACLLEVVRPLFDKEEEDLKKTDEPVSAKDMTAAFAKLYVNIMSIIYYPMLRQEKLMASAREFYEHVKEELDWSDGQLQLRLGDIEEEIAATGAYTQATAEVEIGARLAWRNSAKCIGKFFV